MYELSTSRQLIEAGMPYGKNEAGYPCGREATEWLRTEPDAVVFLPTAAEESGNEHVQVLEVPGKDCLFAVWLQNTREGAPDSRIVYSRSKDGQIWMEPRILAGIDPGEAGEGYMAWIPCSIASPSGRIYVIYTQEVEESRLLPLYTGLLMCRCSDDCGDTWSGPAVVRRPQNPWDPAGRGQLKCMYPMQNPIRMADGRYCAWFTQAVSPDIIPETELGGMSVPDCRAYFAIFENISDDPDPEELRVTWLPDDAKGLCLQPEEPPYSAVEEPFAVQLPNGWLFTVLRNFKGYIYYTVSEDLGHTWRVPQIMRFANGDPFVNPVATPFLCDCGDGRYIQLYYGHAGGYEHMCDFRDRVYRAVGRYAPEEEQPVRFDDKGELYASVDVMAGLRSCSPEVSLEASYTRFHGVSMLWYGDRKHYVLGKRL